MEEEDFSSLSIEDKIIHKSWRARQQAYEELNRKFRVCDGPRDGIFWEFFDYTKKFPLEQNVVAQESAVSCMTAYVECCDPAIGKKLRPEIVTSAIEKGLSAAKVGTRSKTIEFLMILIELDVAEPVIDELIAFLTHKQPKLVAASINCLKEIVKCFGSNVANGKTIMKAISAAFAHADKNVRSEASSLLVELSRWLGPSLLTQLSGLKPVQLKDLQDLCSQVPSTCPTPTRYLRSQRPLELLESIDSSALIDDTPISDDSSVSQSSEPYHTKEVVNTAPVVKDAYEMAESVDINSKLPSSLYDSLSSSSWKDRKEALESLLPVIRVPKISDNSRYGELVDAICKRVCDVNVLVVILAANCLEALANGMRSGFGPYRNSAIAALLEKAKEKKQNVVDAIRSSLDSLRFCISSINENFLEELTSFLTHKNPSVRSETLLWISRLMQSAHQSPSKKDCKSIVDSVISAMDDGTTEVRESAAICLACIHKFLGEAGSSPLFEKLDKIKLNKIKELSLKVQSLASTSAASSVKTASASKANTAIQVPNSSSSRKVPAESQLTSQSATKTRKMDVDSVASIELSFAHSDAESINFFYEWIGETLCSELSDSTWKTRLVAAEQLFVKIDEAAELPLGFSNELLARFFSQKPSWKESNFQVLNKVILCLIRISKHQFYTREAAFLVISGLVEKLSDPKLRTDCAELFMVLAEQVSAAFVVSEVTKLASSQKSPKIQADVVKWLQTAVQAFGIEGVKLSELITLCKSCLSNANPTVRSVAVSLSGTLCAFVGSDFRLLFNDVSPTILTTLDSEFSRVLSGPTVQTTRHSLAHASQISSNSMMIQSTDNSAASASIMEDLIPRTNITSQVNDTLINKLADSSWKVRKAALDDVSQLISSSNNRIKYTGYELFNSLKARLSDSNKNLSLQTLEICGALAEALGSSFDKHIKTILPSVIETLSDNKIQVRQASLKALDRFLSVCPLNSILSSIGPALQPDSPNIRRELLTWTSTILSQNHSSGLNKDDLLELVGPTVLCLQDRNVEVRKAAQSMISALLECLSVESIKKACSDQQPKLMSTLQPLLEAARKTTSSVPPTVLPTVSASVSQPTAPRTPQRAMSMRQARLVTPLKPSASLHSLSEDNSRNNVEECPLLSSDPAGKNTRAEKDKGSARWSFDAPRKDIVDFLREQMIGNVAYALIGKLFSDDFKDNISGMNRFEEFIQAASDDETKSKFVANLDLLLKYITLRFFDTNTSVFIKALELTESIVTFMDNSNYRLCEYEANSFLPFLISKMGDGKEVLRTKIHSIFRQICRIYPASKIFAFFIDGLKNKNSRTRSECLDELAKLLSRNGLSVLQPSRHLPAIGTLISDRDSQVRNAALNVLVQANQLMGPAALQKYLHGLSSKDLDLLDERLKRAAAGIKESPIEKEDVEMSDAPLPQVLDNPAEVASTFGLNLSGVDNSEEENLPAPPMPAFRRSFEPSTLSNPLDRAIDQIQYSTDLVCIHALQNLETHLSGTEFEDDLRARVNDLTHSLIVRMKEATSVTYDVQEVAQMKSRLCRYVTNALILITSNVSLCREMNDDVIELLVSETLSALVSERIHAFEDREQLEKALNILIVKVLEGIPQNRTYSALLTVLREAFRSPPTESEKFPELVMKCIWKLTKQLSASLKIFGRISIPELLSDVHSFLSALPPIEWKMRSNEGLPFQDLPLRTVKTILHEIVQHCGIEVLDELTLIPDPRESFVLSYLKAMLHARNISEQEVLAHMNSKDGLEMEVDQTGSEELEDVEMDGENSAAISTPQDPQLINRNLTVDEITTFLREVCSQICSKPDTRLGLQQLYEFRIAHPYALDQINLFLTGLGDFFHKYIVRSLERIEFEQNQANNLKKSTDASGESGNSVESYKQKLVLLRQQIFGSSDSIANGDSPASNENQPPASPLLRRANSHLESPKMRSIRSNLGPGTPTKLSAAMDLASVSSATLNQASPSQAPASPSSILSLKERLARLRGESSQLSQQ